MKQFLILIAFISINVIKSYSQCEGNLWLFGDSAAIRFDCQSNQPIIESFPIYHGQENYANICDSSGNLIMYLNGPDSLSSYQPFDLFSNLFNFTGSLIENGDSLNTCFSVSNGSIILPFPGHNNYFYIFYINTFQYHIPGMPIGLSYSIVDMNSNSGFGKVIQKNINIVNDSLDDKITSVKHGNGQDWWIISHNVRNGKFYKILLSSGGVSIPISEIIGTAFNSPSSVGEIVFNQSGTQFAIANWILTSGVFLFNFDRCSGIISNEVIYADSIIGIYGLSFCQNGSKLYVSSPGALYQIDLNNPNLNNYIFLGDLLNYQYAALAQHQLGADGKIYICSSYYNDLSYYPLTYFDTSNMYLSVINYPDSLGLACDFEPLNFYLGGHRSKSGLPNMPNYNLSALDESTCDTLGLGIHSEIKNRKSIINIYPNPLSDELSIEILNGVAPKEIEIINALGVQCLMFNVQRPTTQVSVKQLAAGVYFVKIRMQDGGVTVEKFVKE